MNPATKLLSNQKETQRRLGSRRRRVIPARTGRPPLTESFKASKFEATGSARVTPLSIVGPRSNLATNNLGINPLAGNGTGYRFISGAQAFPRFSSLRNKC